jgi:hypothetical protein
MSVASIASMETTSPPSIPNDRLGAAGKAAVSILLGVPLELTEGRYKEPDVAGLHRKHHRQT